MPCSDSSSSISIRLDHDERLIDFDFAKITCGREIEHETGFKDFCRGQSIKNLINLTYAEATGELHIHDEERMFILYLEWDCLRSALAQYAGIDHPEIDRERCQVSEVAHIEEGIEIAQVILPPKELPTILPCSLNQS